MLLVSFVTMEEGKDIRKALGRAVKHYRVDQNISQEKLAELANLDRSYISEIERGLKSASVVTLFRLSNALQTKASELITYIERLEST